MMNYPELTEENIKNIANEVMNTYYGDEKKIIHDVLNQYKYNNNLNEIAIKIAIVDLTSSTHLAQQKSKISLYELANHILKNIPDFDEKVKRGDTDLVKKIAECNGKVNLFSFATKYCAYHNFEIYEKDDYSIYDNVVKKMLPYYSKEVTEYDIEKWRKNYNYEAFNDCIKRLLDENDIHFNNRRRMFDYFLWYPNKKN